MGNPPSGAGIPVGTPSSHVAALAAFVGAPITPALSAPALSLSAAALAGPYEIPVAAPYEIPDVLLPASAAAAVAIDTEKQRQTELLDLALQATAKVMTRFEPLKAKIRSRVRLAEKLKVWGQVLTMVLTSTVVGSIVTNSSHASTVLGFLALAASLLGFVANSALGSDSKFVEEFGEASAKYETTSQLHDRLLIYQKRPGLFLDIDDRIKEADDLRRYLSERIEKWGLRL